MKKTVGVILKRIGRDIRQYKWAGAAFLIYYIVVKAVFHAFCPLLILTGLPCPGCGTTRALIYIFRGQFGRALQLNPCAFLMVLFGVYFVYIYRMVTEFPGYPPMTFRRDNILNRIFPFYNDFLRHLFGI